MQIHLIRHGLTEGTKIPNYIGGRTDEPLCAEGVEQAGTFRNPQVKKAYVSPMLRCLQTAAIIFPNAELVKIEGFREIDFGDFEGKSAADLKNNSDYAEWVNSNCEFSCPNGENMSVFNERIRQAFITLTETANKNREQQLYIVAHGGTIMAIMSHLNPNSDYFDWRTKHLNGYAFAYNPSNNCS
ncbi:MAG: histidine phosphatase family protein [Clostridiales bacterium]|jgi:alpha-ribazole phosphatase|nr:histidine phosphatase family protein [Clostridiales bacterium]